MKNVKDKNNVTPPPHPPEKKENKWKNSNKHAFFSRKMFISRHQK